MACLVFLSAVLTVGGQSNPGKGPADSCSAAPSRGRPEDSQCQLHCPPYALVAANCICVPSRPPCLALSLSRSLLRSLASLVARARNAPPRHADALMLVMVESQAGPQGRSQRAKARPKGGVSVPHASEWMEALCYCAASVLVPCTGLGNWRLSTGPLEAGNTGCM